MTDHREAFARLEEIHQHLARTEVYRGYRALPVALSGLVGIAAAALQPVLMPPQGPPELFAYYWIGVAGAAGGLAFLEIAYGYLRETSPTVRRRTRIVTSQFIPCVAAGLVITLCLAQMSRTADVVGALPGIWAILFSLGIFASRTYLPHLMGWVGLGYFVAGSTLLVAATSWTTPSPWSVGIPFGVGQLASAAVLYWNLERTEKTHGT